MLFPVIDSTEWANLHKLEIQSTICLCCKKTILINVPVAMKKYRGFKTESHGCPKKYEQYYLAPCNYEEQLKLEAAIN